MKQNMKKRNLYTAALGILAAVLFTMLGSVQANAQKFAYVNSQYILDNMPEYQAAQKQLDGLSQRWQIEIDNKISELGRKRSEYEAEKVLLTEDMRLKREAELSASQNAILDLQRKRFGPKGDLIQKQAELIKPIQDKVYQTIQTVAETKNYGMIFDKAGTTTIMYGNDRFDISDQILREMGIEPGKGGEEDDPNDDLRNGEGVIEQTRQEARDVIKKP